MGQKLSSQLYYKVREPGEDIKFMPRESVEGNNRLLKYVLESKALYHKILGDPGKTNSFQRNEARFKQFWNS